MSRHWPAVAAVGLFLAAVMTLVWVSVRQNEGHLVYALDDPYISMSIARNVAEHGVWGVTKYDFTSSSSSLLWVLLLSAWFALFGVSDVAPLILNVVFGTALIAIAYVFLKRERWKSLHLFLALAAVIFVAPLPGLALCGMEHTLHAAVSVAFALTAAKVLSTGGGGKRTGDVMLLALAPLVTAARFEGVFLIAVVGILLVLKRRWAYSAAVACAGAVPVVIYGLFSMAHGWQFLPASVLLKGDMPSLTSLGAVVRSLGYTAVAKAEADLPMYWLVIGAAAVVIYRDRVAQAAKWDEAKVSACMFVAVALLHLQFARTGQFYRYEAYLVALGVIVVGPAVARLLAGLSWPRQERARAIFYLSVALLAAFVFAPFGARAGHALKSAPRATSNIFEQQYQMGLFLRRFYQGSSVAVNDIGLVSYLADVRITDLFGLSSLQVARSKSNDQYTTETIDSLTRKAKVRIAIVYDRWCLDFGGVPHEWIKVGEWVIPKNIVCGGDTVAFYAVGPSEEERLARSLKAFSEELPSDVEQKGEYLK